MIGNAKIADENEYYISGLSAAQAVLDEAKTKFFDQRSVNNILWVADSLTAPAGFGPEIPEKFLLPDTLSNQAPFTASARGYLSSVRYNDIDDYHGYRRLVNTPRVEGYKIYVTVNYANEIYPDSPSGVKTFCKKMNIIVTNPYFQKRDSKGILVPDTLRLSYAFAY